MHHKNHHQKYVSFHALSFFGNLLPVWADSLQRQLEHDNNKTFKSISTLFLNMQHMNFFIENQFFHFDLPWKQPMLHSFVHVFSSAYFPKGEVWRKSNIENSLIHFHYGSVQYYFVYVRLEKRVLEPSYIHYLLYQKDFVFQGFDNWNDTISI